MIFRIDGRPISDGNRTKFSVWEKAMLDQIPTDVDLHPPYGLNVEFVLDPEAMKDNIQYPYGADLDNCLPSVPIWDIAAAMYALDGSLFKTLDTTLRLGRFGDAEYGLSEGRPIRIVVDYDPTAVWERFFEICNDPGSKRQRQEMRNS